MAGGSSTAGSIEGTNTEAKNARGSIMKVSNRERASSEGSDLASSTTEGGDDVSGGRQADTVNDTSMIRGEMENVSTDGGTADSRTSECAKSGTNSGRLTTIGNQNGSKNEDEIKSWSGNRDGNKGGRANRSKDEGKNGRKNLR